MWSYVDEYEPGKKMDDYQIKAIESVKHFKSKWMLLRSGEGTGKSSITRAIAEWLHNAWHKVVVITSVKDIEIDLKIEIPYAEVMCMPTFTNRYEELNDGAFLIFDEWHHTSAKKIGELCMWKGRFILSTASPDRANEYGEDWFRILTGTIHETNTEALPIKVYYKDLKSSFDLEYAQRIVEDLPEDSPQRRQKLLAYSPERNKLIIQYAVDAYKKHGKVLVATNYVNHAQYLYTEILKKVDDVLLYTWTTNRKKIKASLKEMKRYILVCTIGVVKEWFNVKDLMVGILGLDVSSYTRYRQFAWRMRRKFDGKTHWYLIDFKDSIEFVSWWNAFKTKYMNFGKRKKYMKQLDFTLHQLP
jgi:superfamily II DNA or RNA helicase